MVHPLVFLDAFIFGLFVIVVVFLHLRFIIYGCIYLFILWRSESVENKTV